MQTATNRLMEKDKKKKGALSTTCAVRRFRRRIPNQLEDARVCSGAVLKGNGGRLTVRVRRHSRVQGVEAQPRDALASHPGNPPRPKRISAIKADEPERNGRARCTSNGLPKQKENLLFFLLYKCAVGGGGRAHLKFNSWLCAETVAMGTRMMLVLVALFCLVRLPLSADAATTIQEIRVFDEAKLRAEHRTQSFRTTQFLVSKHAFAKLMLSEIIVRICLALISLRRARVRMQVCRRGLPVSFLVLLDSEFSPNQWLNIQVSPYAIFDASSANISPHGNSNIWQRVTITTSPTAPVGIAEVCIMQRSKLLLLLLLLFQRCSQPRVPRSHAVLSHVRTRARCSIVPRSSTMSRMHASSGVRAHAYACWCVCNRAAQISFVLSGTPSGSVTAKMSRPLALLFNPFHPQDATYYPSNQADLDEYLFNEEGILFRGNACAQALLQLLSECAYASMSFYLDL